MPSNIATSIPIIGGMFDDSADQAAAELAKNRALYGNIQKPDLNWDTYTPEAYSNQSANYQTTQDDPIVKSAQMAALAKMSGLSDTGLSEADQAGFAAARDQGNQEAKSGTDAAIANAQARGVGGSGLDFAMREAANQAGASRANQAGLQQAATAAQQRAMYNQAYGNQLAGVRSQDYQTAKDNTDTVNKFNLANTQAKNQTNNANVENQNNAFLTNQNGKNSTAQQNFNNDMTVANAEAGVNNSAANADYAQNAANTSNRNAVTGAAVSAGLGLYGINKKYGEDDDE